MIDDSDCDMCFPKLPQIFHNFCNFINAPATFSFVCLGTDYHLVFTIYLKHGNEFIFNSHSSGDWSL